MGSGVSLQPQSRARARQIAGVNARKLSASLGNGRLCPGVLNIAMQNGGYLPYFTHQLVKLIRKNRLYAIRKSVLRIMVDLHHQSICSNSNCRPREWQDLVALSRAMAGINNNRQVAQPLH